MTRKIYIKPAKKQSTIEHRAKLLLEGSIEDDGDDEVLDTAIAIAHGNNLDVVFVRQGYESEKEKEISAETAFNIRYECGFRIRA
jgi:hypothetical protein